MPALTIGYCFACDKTGIPVYNVGAVDPFFRACFACRRKHRTKVLRNVANEIVAASVPKSKEFTVCRHCSAPVMALPGGGVPLLCQDCIHEWHQIGADAAAAAH